jgi:hypothetical protein
MARKDSQKRVAFRSRVSSEEGQFHTSWFSLLIEGETNQVDYIEDVVENSLGDIKLLL